MTSSSVELGLLFMGTSENSCLCDPLDSDEDLVARISEAVTARVCEIPGKFVRVRQSLYFATLDTYCKHYTYQQQFQ
ncbi:hypothetical protein TNCV_4497001 [Trichonephila clavipes]|nr:hypothetical protein TNCV_4497001 [Trichonephila clavipes]